MILLLYVVARWSIGTMIAIGHILDMFRNVFRLYSRFAVVNYVYLRCTCILKDSNQVVTLRSTFSEGACPQDHLEGCGHIVRSSTLHSTLFPGCPQIKPRAPGPGGAGCACPQVINTGSSVACTCSNSLQMKWLLSFESCLYPIPHWRRKRIQRRVFQ